MGIAGTDVTKSVADMVLTDDNFATIILAVEEGRKIYSNIRKCIQYLLSANLSEVLSVLVATLAGGQLLYTIQILWINLISDTFPALALGVEKAEKDIMSLPPRDAQEGIFSGMLGVSVAYQGIVMSLLTLAAYFIGLQTSPQTATTMAFCTLTFTQMFHSLNARSLDKSLFTIGFFTNKAVIYSLLASIVLTVGIVMIPGLNGIFHLASLNGLEWFQVFLLSAAILPIVELVKYIYGKKTFQTLKKNALIKAHSSFFSEFVRRATIRRLFSPDLPAETAAFPNRVRRSVSAPRPSHISP